LRHPAGRRRRAGHVADVAWHRADVVIWLAYRLPLIVSRVTRRNLCRLTGREPAPAGAFGWKRAFFSRKSVLANAVRTYVHNRGKYAARLSQTAALGVQVLRFRAPCQAEKWLATVTPETSTWPDAPGSE
jgi:hypothetical protein